MGTSDYRNYTVQQVVDASISGDLFDLPAGSVALATGAEWRKLKSTTTADARSYASAYRLVNTQPFFGEYSIKEAFVETQIPVLKDAPFARSLDTNLAARLTNYSTSGSVTTWKAGLSWQIHDDLRLRATRSRDIRAPNLNELFAGGSQNNLVISDTPAPPTGSGTGLSYSAVPNKTFGNIALQPEVAATTVVGFVYQPSWLEDFSLAADYYLIDIDDSIANAGGQVAVTQCNLSASSPLCAFVTRGPTAINPTAAATAVTETRTSPVNLNSQRTTGVDLEASYRMSLGAGDLSVRLLGGYVFENFTDSPLAVTVNNAGNGTASLPHVRGTLSLNYSRGPLTTFLQTRYIGGMTWDKTKVLGVTTDFNEVPSAAYFDGQVSYKVQMFGEDQQVFLNVQNILDKQPVYDPTTGGATPVPTDTGLYDQVGRMFRVGVKMRF